MLKRRSATSVNLLTDASAEFNKALLLGFGSPANPNILYVDAPYYFNLVTGSPSSYGFDNADDPVCTSVDAMPAKEPLGSRMAPRR